MKLNHPLAAAIVLFFASGAHTPNALASKAVYFEKLPILFDISTEPRLSPAALAVGPEAIYTDDKGYGWLSKEKRTSLERHELAKSRDELTIDSVSSTRLKFRVNLTPGEWQMTFWMEAGMEDQNSAHFLVQGKRQTLNWYTFDAPAEPRTKLRPQYRLYHGRATVGKKGLVLEWKGQNDLVRLNGLQFFPDTPLPDSLQKIKESQVQILLRIKEAGRFNSILPLDSIITDLNQTLEKNPSALYAHYWHHQLTLLAKSEEYFEGLRGWEWSRKKTDLSMFDRYGQAIMLIDGLLAHATSTHPLYERALYQRGRLLYWLDREGHGNNYEGITPKDLVELYQRHPDNNILAMYANKKIDTHDRCDEISLPANAATWSIKQNEVLCRTKLLTHWWIKNRQDDNGELGGKYGDDVEMLRWWTIPLLAGDITTSQGWKKLATGVWHSDRLEEGYYKKASDVEHASEPISDTAPLLTFLNEPEYTDRLAFSARHFLNRWTVLNDHGRRYFKSAWFGALTIDERPPRNRDLPMNGRATKAVRYYAWRNRDAETVKALHEWARAWAYATMRTDKGKPAGIVPASIRASDEAINGDEPTWYQANMFWDYFNWQHEAGQQIYDLLLFTSQLTGDQKLLEPLFAATDLIKDYVEKPTPDTTTVRTGSENWAIKRLRHSPAFWSVLEQWRLLNNDTRYDEMLKKHGGPYIKYRLTGDKKHLILAPELILETIRYNFPMLTREALFTDRVYIARTDGGIDPIPQIIGMLTGSLRTSSPYADITWENSPQGFTALVADASNQHLEIETRLFNNVEHDISFRLWRLNPGKYTISITKDEKSIYRKNLVFKERGQIITFPLKPNEEYKIHIAASN